MKQVCCLGVFSNKSEKQSGLGAHLCPLSALSVKVTDFIGQLLIPLPPANIYFLYFRVGNDKRFVK